jgi:myosin-1
MHCSLCVLNPGTDDKFLQKVLESYGSHAHLSGGMGQGEFLIRHYAGDVSYNCEGFCDRNRDLLFNDLIDLAGCTNSSLIPQLFPEAKFAADKRRPSTAGFKIKVDNTHNSFTIFFLSHVYLISYL